MTLQEPFDVRARPRPGPARIAANSGIRQSRAFAKLSQSSGAIAAAVLLHLAIVLAVGISLDRTELHFQAVGGGSGAILASLTPAAALSGATAKPPTDALDAIVHTLGDAPNVSVDASRSTTKGADLLAQLDRSLTSPPHGGDQAKASPQPSPAPGTNAGLISGDNPWSHASAAAINASKVHELWAAIKPCWRGHIDEGVASIRVVLDPHGEVVTMTALGQVGGQSRSSAEALAAAVTACAPYRVGRPDAYLVTGPV